MNESDLRKVLESLEECYPDVEGSWGPCYELAKKRREEAIALLRYELKLKRK